MSLIDVCYQQIQENFWIGLFGGFKLIIDRNTGYFNATKLCQDGGKHFKEWIKNKTSKELIALYEGANPSAGNPLTSQGTKATYCVSGNQCDTISGTYVRRELLLAIGSWISFDFYDKCYRILEDYFVSEYRARCKQLETQAKSLKDELQHASNQVDSS